MINDTVGRASLLPRLATSQNRVYPCTGYRSAYYTIPLRLYQRTTASILPARSSDLSFLFHRTAWSLHLRLRFLKLGPGFDHGGIQNGNFRLSQTYLIWVTTIHLSWTFQLDVLHTSQAMRNYTEIKPIKKDTFCDLKLTLENRIFLD